jgi:hypothetical protein
LGNIGKTKLSFKWSSLFWSHNSAENNLKLHFPMFAKNKRKCTIIYVNEVNRPRDLSEKLSEIGPWPTD